MAKSFLYQSQTKTVVKQLKCWLVNVKSCKDLEQTCQEKTLKLFSVFVPSYLPYTRTCTLYNMYNLQTLGHTHVITSSIYQRCSF